MTANLMPIITDIYDLGATGIQFKDVHFSGSLYNNGSAFQGGISGLTYRATGPTGPTGQATGPTGPTIQLGAHLVPTVDNVYDLGATGLRFRDLHVGGSTIYLGDSVTLSASAGTLKVNSAPLVSSSVVLNTGPGGIGNSEGFARLNLQLTTAMADTNPGNIAMSADGKYVSYITGNPSANIYISSNYGANFTTKGDLNTYNAIAVSSTGQYQAATVNGSGVFFSSDYGSTWNNVGLTSESTWNGIKISTDGKIVFAWASAGAHYYITKDIIPTGNSDWLGPTGFSDIISATNIYMSDSGDRILRLYNEGMVYKVIGYKVTRDGALTVISASGTVIESFTFLTLPSVALSRDGTRIGIYGPDAVVADYYIKTNQYTWNLSGLGTITLVLELSVIRPEDSSSWTYFPTAMSSDGTIQLVGTGGNLPKGLYISYNSGTAWTYMGGSTGDLYKNWYYTLMSSDGEYINIINATSEFWQCFATTLTVSVTDLSYTPTYPGEWPTALVPTTVGEALDAIANYLNLYQSDNEWTNLT
jgi:hypothetical protein